MVDIEVDIIGVEILERLLDRLLRKIGAHVLRQQFRSDEDVLALHTACSNPRRHIVFVLIHCISHLRVGVAWSGTW